MYNTTFASLKKLQSNTVFFFNTSLVDVFIPSIPIPTVGINSSVLQCQLMIEIVIGTNPHACLDIIFFFFLEMR